MIDVDDAVELHVVEGVDIDEGDHCEDQVGLSDDAPKMSVAVESGEPRLKSPVCNTGTEVMMTCPALVPLGATRMTVSMYDTPASVTSTPVAVAIAAGNAEVGYRRWQRGRKSRILHQRRYLGFEEQSTAIRRALVA